MNGTPALIGLDWGTSSLRGFLFGGDGRILAERATAHGIQNLPLAGVDGFESAFAGLCGDWLTTIPAVPVAAGGMVGSAQGWKEAPYVPCPADVRTLADHAVAVDSVTGRRILIAPGLLTVPADSGSDGDEQGIGGAPDVLRGEEIQIAGALADNPGWAACACVAMPGTHSKWVRVIDGRILGFSTYMTGELFAVLKTHSILGRLMPPDGKADDALEDAAFAAGIRAAASAPGDLPHQLFATRSLGLTGRMAPEGLTHYLSGLLIGHELVSGLARKTADLPAGTPLLLVGDASLCRRYARGLTLLGTAPAALLGNTAPRGLYRFAIAAGLLPAG